MIQSLGRRISRFPIENVLNSPLRLIITSTSSSQTTFTRGFAKEKKSSKSNDKSTTNNTSSTTSISANEKNAKALEVLTSGKEKMKEKLDYLEKKLSSIRTGGADPVMLENLSIETKDGKKYQLNNIGMVTALNQIKLVVTLTDRSLTPLVEKAISTSNLGLTARGDLDKGVIEVPIPRTTKEQRESRIKNASEETEKSKIGIRGVRQDVQKKLKGLTLSEDDLKTNEKKLQTVTEAAIEKAVSVFEKKKKELQGNSKSSDDDE